MIRQNDAARAGCVLLVCWAGVWIGLLSLASTKLPSYIIPCYPAFAIGFALLIDRWFSDVEPAASKRWLRAAWGTTAAVGVGILIVVPIVLRIYLNGEWMPALVGCIPLCGAAVGLWYSERGNVTRSLATLAVVGILFCVSLLGFAVLPIDAHQNSPGFSEFVREHAIGEPRLASHNYLPPSLVYYHGQSIDRLRTPADIAHFFAENPQDAFLITTSKHFPGFSDTLPPDVTVLKRDRRFLRDGEVVLLGRNPTIGTAKHRPKRRAFKG
jgi:hypothetical protein